jgi:hypothetical protein
MTFRELLTKFSLDELWYYLSMRHGLRNKPIKACKVCKLYASARDELLALELNREKTHGELFCEFCADKIDEWSDSFFVVLLKEAEEEKTFAIDFIPWKDIIDLPVSQASLDRYGELLCVAEILWESTFYGYSAGAVASESDLLFRDSKSEEAEFDPFEPDEYKHEVNPIDVEATLTWFANAPDCVKHSVRNCISANVIYDEDDEQLAIAKTLEKLEEIVENERDAEDITRLPLVMTRGLDIDDTLLLLRAFDGTLMSK